ncbi:MerR family transcriptional regulator [Lactobacillus delbrueckii]|uniref:helix-turn-helix domain-containing protein n=1 Tax=Lactobacillus delbrueckii TaxID=1584 RepID=UPI001BFF7125|nr:MerR family transcriptional regulator [Lactobacillus delbrueckii]MBT9023227.1 transcriptional regulator [Lactobacillus delbrueckii subsp. bulgaricus]MCD5459894.1 helix-turn-helix domain-containing protein [Lactobacillus delbrueckii subsp. bulgaricus]MCT3481043.1 MerR family transcriptional regulator [Lactobacillus delbrueckii subsp. bulgaricus]MCT3495059.1 MerR family transcriptional regulator [Lactobacillus delbrueckii subsp. bulgaricus]
MSEKSEQMKTSEAAQALGVSENTLRKYSQAVEKAASPAYFPRVKNIRRYRPEDLTVLKQMQDLVKAGQKIDQAAQELFAGEKEEAPVKTAREDQLEAALAAKDQEIAELKEQLAQLTAAKAAEKPEASLDPAADVLDLPDFDDGFLEDEPVTPEQKRAQVVADMAKSDQEVHKELLSRTQENAAKGAPTYRTLADMQLAPKKTPWWKKIFK